MKAIQETPKAFDRMSTQEELHQVLDLLGELERPGMADAMRVEDEDGVEAVSDLWQETTSDGQREVLPQVDSWTEFRVKKSERIN